MLLLAKQTDDLPAGIPIFGNTSIKGSFGLGAHGRLLGNEFDVELLVQLADGLVDTLELLFHVMDEHRDRATDIDGAVLAVT